MRRKLAAVALTTALSGTFAVAAASAANAAPADSTPSTPAHVTSQAPARAGIAPVSINQVLPDGSTLAGTFSVTHFVAQNGQLIAEGVFNGTLTSAAGAVTPITNVVGTSPVTSAANAAANTAASTAGGATSAATSATSAATPAATPGTCSVLNLVLGPLHLNLLGLVVDLNQVNLNITAQSGNGNLLGNLLCSVAGLLDNGTGLQGVANILNNLLGGL